MHGWDVAPKEAVAIQNELRERVELRPLPKRIRFVAGADIAFNKFSPEIHAGIVVLELPDLRVVESAGVVSKATFPYVPGLLSFRESPAVLEVLAKLSRRPDVIVTDGAGYAHPRRFGIACHLGLLTGIPSIGCAKSLLVGEHEPPGETSGSAAPIVHKGETVGVALRTKDRTNPVFVSPGHLSDVESSAAFILQCVRGYPERSKYRVPEPTRLADLFVNALRRGETWAPPAR